MKEKEFIDVYCPHCGKKMFSSTAGSNVKFFCKDCRHEVTGTLSEEGILKVEAAPKKAV